MQRMVRDGGLMRCCLDMLSKYQGREVIGTVVTCECGARVKVARDGVWEWDQSSEPKR